MTVSELTSLQGKQKGNLENSSIIHKKNLFPDVVGNGPLKSMFNRSIGCVDLIRVLLIGLKKRGLISEQVVQLLQHRLTSSKEYGKFLDLTKCHRRVTPGQQSSL